VVAPRVVAPSHGVVERHTTGQGEERLRRTEELRRERPTTTTGTTTQGAGTANIRGERGTIRRETTGVSPGGNAGNRTVRATAALSVPQRTRLVQTITQARDVNRVRRGEFRVAVGQHVPRHLHLRRLPAAFFAILPAYAAYEYVVVDDDIVIVDPGDYAIVDVLPASAAGEQVAVVGGLHFSARERELIRQAAFSERSTAGVSGDVEVAIGSVVPEGITVQRFPDDLYAEIPQLRGLRFIVDRDQVLLVDPENRRVAAVI
jgi:hypothetical protein